MGSFWENERQIAAMQLAVTAGQAGRTIVDRWNARVRAHQMELRVREAYNAALTAAKDTGDMPEEFQSSVPIDELGKLIAIKSVALNELAKYVPDHPLVVSETAQDVIAQVTLINYNRAERPVDADGVIHYSAHIPDEETIDAIYKAYPGE
ncbi:hypothetical protein [uncultured Herbaspirillum sp.]|uniref:hypothetical protein n=1 Tax=uncultured Herbaspirillum sp. TaxID=160236 RepID=UPI0025896811|nr:hypothetical protein [uncultured Herbaspirillum sp.]